jgi:phosphate-selective porin OprO/OprP
MKLTTKVTLIALAIIAPSLGMAHAQQAQSDTALVERLKQLEQEMRENQAKLDELKAAIKGIETQAPAAAKPDNAVNWKGAPEVKNKDGWSVKPRGRMLYDFANLSGVPNTIDIPGEGFSNEARRVRLGIQGTMPGGFGYKLEADLPGGVSLTDAYLDYKTDGLKITIGQHNNFQGFEELTSSNDSSFIERAAFTDAFGFQRKLGISAQFKAGDINLQTGIFTDNLDDLDDGNNAISLDFRAFASPKISGMQMHFGGSLHTTDLGDSIDTVRYRARPMVHSVDTRFINTDRIAGAEKEFSYGLEYAVISDRFHAMAEMHSMTVERNGFDDATFFGGAIEAGYFLTNDTRVYSGGVFKGAKVSQPVSAGGMGAWQVNFRFDTLDLVDADIVGGTQDAFMASLIWTPINNVRFLTTFGRISYKDTLDIVSGAPADFSVNVVAARAQISF